MRVIGPINREPSPSEPARETTSRDRLVAKPLRIAFVVSTFDYGGLERCVARIVNHLNRSEFSPLIICLNRAGEARGWIDEPGVPIVELRKRPGNDPRVVLHLARTLKNSRVDLVHSHNWGTLLETAVAARLAGVAGHLHVEHGMELDALQTRGLRRRLRTLAMRWGLRQADAVAAVTDSVRSRIVDECKLPPQQVKLVPNGVDVEITPADMEKAFHLRKQLNIPENARVIGSVGRLAPVKDFGNAIQALGHLQQWGHDAHLVILGDGPERQQLAELARHANVNARTHLVGQQENIAAWLAFMDIYVNCSISEAMNLGILEAMSVGLPTVVTNVGGSPALVDGGEPCGLVVPPSDPAALAKALAVLLANVELRAAMAARAKAKHASQYGTAGMTAIYEDIYRQLARASRSGQKRPDAGSIARTAQESTLGRDARRGSP